MKSMRFSHILLIGAAVLLAIVAATGFYRVNEGSQAVLMTFGKMTSLKTPGFYWRVPFIQSVEVVSVSEIHTLEYGFRTTQSGTTTSEAAYRIVDEEAIMLTGDGNIVRVEAVYQVVVGDVPSFLFEVDNPYGSLQNAFETIMRRNIQNRTLDDALLNKQDIEREVLPDFQRLIAAYRIGIEVREVRIQNIIVPDEVAPAYEDVNNAKNEKTRKLDEAERYYNEVVPAARAEAYRMVQEAEAYRAETVARAEGDVAVFTQVLEKYRLSPDITRTRLLIETLEQILGSADHIYVVPENAPGLIELLPLDGPIGGNQ
ncbi:MAG: FtsH protease activity modulator HflK [Clostridiales bacterium]|nr:FtsH protease activity modulator HflK [Clostridiales bacterium]